MSGLRQKKNIYLLKKYEQKLSIYEKKLETGSLEYYDLLEIDGIRLFAIENSHQDLLYRSRQILLRYIDGQFGRLHEKIKSKGTETSDDDRLKMLLFWREKSIEVDDPRSIRHIDEEYKQIRSKVETIF